MGLWAALSIRCPWLWQGAWNYMSSKVPSNPNASMILWLLSWVWYPHHALFRIPYCSALGCSQGGVFRGHTMVVVIAVASELFLNHWSLLLVISKSKGVFVFCIVGSLFTLTAPFWWGASVFLKPFFFFLVEIKTLKPMHIKPLKNQKGPPKIPSN